MAFLKRPVCSSCYWLYGLNIIIFRLFAAFLLPYLESLPFKEFQPQWFVFKATFLWAAVWCWRPHVSEQLCNIPVISEVVKYCLYPIQILDRVENLLHRPFIVSSDKNWIKLGVLYILITLFMFSPNCHFLSHLVGLPWYDCENRANFCVSFTTYLAITKRSFAFRTKY